MKVYCDCINLTRDDFDQAGFYNGPFEVSQLVNCDVKIAGGLGMVTFPKPVDDQDKGGQRSCPSGGLCTTGRICVGRETEIRVNGPLYAKSLIADNVYVTHEMGVGSLKIRGNLICEMQVQVVKSFYVGGRIVTPRLLTSSLDIQLPQRYYHEHSVPKKG